MKPEFFAKNELGDGATQLSPPDKRSRFEEVEEAYVPATDMEDSALAPAELSNPFWN